MSFPCIATFVFLFRDILQFLRDVTMDSELLRTAARVNVLYTVSLHTCELLVAGIFADNYVMHDLQ